MTIGEEHQLEPIGSIRRQGGQPPISSEDIDLRALVHAHNALAGRIALLEGSGRRNEDAPTSSSADAADDPPQPRPRRSSPQAKQNVSFPTSNEVLLDGDSFYSIKDEDSSAEEAEEEALTDRILQIEQRLDHADEEKMLLSADDERKYLLQESTFSLLITHNPFSVPFAFAVFTVALSITCLCLTLSSAIQKGSTGNPLGIPGGVDPAVTAAQFLGKL